MLISSTTKTETFSLMLACEFPSNKLIQVYICHPLAKTIKGREKPAEMRLWQNVANLMYLAIPN